MYQNSVISSQNFLVSYKIFTTLRTLQPSIYIYIYESNSFACPFFFFLFFPLFFSFFFFMFQQQHTTKRKQCQKQIRSYKSSGNGVSILSLNLKSLICFIHLPYTLRLADRRIFKEGKRHLLMSQANIKQNYARGWINNYNILYRQP